MKRRIERILTEVRQPVVQVYWEQSQWVIKLGLDLEVTGLKSSALMVAWPSILIGTASIFESFILKQIYQSKKLQKFKNKI